MSKYKNIDELSKILKNSRKKTVLVHGIFDILHKGHISLLTESKKLGDILVVGLDNDDNARILKGKNRPFNKFESRLAVLEQIEQIDYIFEIPSLEKVGDYDSFFKHIYTKISPDVVATNLGAGKHGVYKKERAEILGIRFENVGEVYSRKTTDIIDMMRE